MNKVGRQRNWSEKELLTIREMYIEGRTQAELAIMFKTTQKTISNIVNLIEYADVGIPPLYDHKLMFRKKVKK